MLIWINGAFGAGKTTAAYELHRRLENSIVYDPEHIGYFLRGHLPESVQTGDFQDLPMWRSSNYETLRFLAGKMTAPVIIPMTLADKRYYDELIGRLLADGVDLRHFILTARRETLQKRLNRRFERGETWAKRQIDRCIEAFDTVIAGEKIQTDDKSVDEIVGIIAESCGLTLRHDSRGKLRKSLDRAIVLLRHVR